MDTSMPYHVSAMQTGLSRSFRGKVEEKAFERCFENGGDINQRHHADRERKKSDNNWPEPDNIGK